MKSFLGEILRALTWNPVNEALYVLYKKLATKITGDNSLYSRKNKVLGIVLMLMTLPSLLLCLMTYSFFTLQWSDLQKYYANARQVEYQDNTYEIVLSAPHKPEKKTTFLSKLMLETSGFYFSKPSEFFGDYSKGNIMLFERPLYIPWTAITECRKIDYKKFNKMRFHIDKANVFVEIALWDFLKPLCIQNDIPVVEE